MMLRGKKTVLTDERGVAALEFAMVSPVFIIIVLAILEFSSAYFTQQVMENVSYNITRLAKTGFVQAGMTQEETVMNMLNQRLSGLVAPEDINIDSRTYEEFSDIDQNEPFVDADNNGVRDEGENYTDTNGNGEYDGALSITGYGQAGQITVYQVTVPWRVMTPVLGNLAGEDGEITLTSHIVVRNEPYDNDAGN